MAAHHTPIDGPIPGEAMTGKPKTLPFDRPARYADPQQAMDFIYRRMLQPKVAMQLLSVLEAGCPIEILVEMILQQGFGEGHVSVTALPVIVGPITVILYRMADAAGIKPRLTTDPEIKIPSPLELSQARKRISSQELSASAGAAQKSYKDVTKHIMPTAKNAKGLVGFMSPFFPGTGTKGQK